MRFFIFKIPKNAIQFYTQTSKIFVDILGYKIVPPPHTNSKRLHVNWKKNHFTNIFSQKKQTNKATISRRRTNKINAFERRNGG
jgi:hypothetical protein